MAGMIGFGVVVVLFAGSLGLALAFGARQIRRSRQHLEALAAQTGLGLQELPKQLGFRQVPEVQGVSRGKAVRVYAYHTGSGKSRTDWAAVAATPARPSALTFRIAPQGFGTKVAALFGAREIEVGDPAFDRHWFIQTNAPDYLRAALIPELRAKLAQIVAQGGDGTCETTEGTIRYAERGWFSDRRRAERYAAVLEAVCDLADIAEVYADHTDGAP